VILIVFIFFPLVIDLALLYLKLMIFTFFAFLNLFSSFFLFKLFV